MCLMLSWIFLTIHNIGLPTVVFALGVSLLAGCISWIIYLAIEPFLRRRWPQLLINWNRLISGDWRDPVVARDVLLGCAFGVLSGLLIVCQTLVVTRVLHAQTWNTATFSTFLGMRFLVGNVLLALTISIFLFLGLTILISLLWLILKRKMLVIVGSVLIWNLFFLALLFQNNPHPAIWSILSVIVLDLLLSAMGMFVLIRFGLLGAVMVFFTALLIGTNMSGTTLDGSSWYAGYGYAGLSIFAVIVLCAFWFSLGGRPLLGTPHLDD